MPRVERNIFGGLLTDLSPVHTPSGSADVALNVTVRNGDLQKRGGFVEWEDDAKQDGSGITWMGMARFIDGSVYVVVKIGTALYRRQVGTSDFVAISGGQTHNATDTGWGFMYADRFHYFDRVGGTRWNPVANDGTAYKAGITRPTAGVTYLPTVGGGKDGRYFFAFTYRNSVTREEGPMCSLSSISTHDIESDDKGAISISDWNGTGKINAANNADNVYDWDEVCFYSTLGNTEYIDLGTGHETPSYKLYLDAVHTASHDGLGGLPSFGKADHVLDRRQGVTNAGGLPPGAQIGMIAPTVHGPQGVYGRVYVDDTLRGDSVQFSLPGYPTMVPREQTYSAHNKTVIPIPWVGEVRGAMVGQLTAMASGGGTACAFTPTASYRMASQNGRIVPAMIHPSKGAAGQNCVCGTPYGVEAMGYLTWLTVGSDGISDRAERRFSTTLDDIPLTQTGSAVLAYYSFHNQVWAAVAKSGSTYNKRILVYDIPQESLTIFEPACLGATESITAMCELSYTDANPTMLVATNKGRILQYPSGARDQNADGSYADYACQWRGYYGQERVGYRQRIVGFDVLCGSNVKDNVTLGFRRMLAPDETRTQKTVVLHKSSERVTVALDLDEVWGQFFQVEFTSTDSVTTQWTIRDLALTIKSESKEG